MRLSQNLMLLPVLAQVLLTFAILIVLATRRRHSMKVQGRQPEDMKHAQDHDWERPAELASRSFKNQFELPVLFFAVCAFAVVTRSADVTLFALAWVFVLARGIQSVAHLADMTVVIRASAYLLGAAVLALMWVVLTLNVFRYGV
ncbi:MAG: MAPEG family protein [Hyphomicrobiaceae bacterium]